MNPQSQSEEKKIAGEAYEFSHTVRQYPTDENLCRLREMVMRVMALTTHKDVAMHARLTIAAVSKALSFKTAERRLKEMPHIDHSLYRVAHIDR